MGNECSPTVLWAAGIQASSLNRQLKGELGRETIIEITPTSGGFGLQGGALFKCSPDGYLAKCPECYEKNFKIDDNQKSGI